ncbi:MAG: hypothetical protein FWD64_08050, partial [Acidobacteriaceae bacterium]|nr:hypothetical protein [Acidobacteriaceae bacterium]
MSTVIQKLHPILLVSVFLIPVFLPATAKGQTASSGQQNTKAGNASLPYKDAALPIEDRVRDLLPRMTMEEKIDQIATWWE